MISNIFSAISEIARPVSWALFDSLWQGGLVTAGLMFLLFFISDHKARLRYAFACLAMLLILFFTINSFITYYHSPAIGTAMVPDYPAPTVVDLPTPSFEKTAAESTSSPLTIRIMNFLSPGLFIIWVTGVIFISFYHLLGWYQTRSIFLKGTEVFSLSWNQYFHDLTVRMNLRKPIKIVKSVIAGVPCVVGWIKPMVIIPVGVVSGLSEEELEMIIIHELAHIRRHDILINYIQTVMEILFFLNPAIWIISRRIRIEREHCCDDIVIKISGDKIKYARALTSLETLRTPVPHLATSARAGSLLQRISRIIGLKSTGNSTFSLSIANTISIIVLLTTALTLIGITSDRATAQIDITTVSAFEPQDNDIEGFWEIAEDNGEQVLEIRFSRKIDVMYSVEVDNQIEIKPGKDIIFKLERDAGIFYFKGDIEADHDFLYGEGNCYFRASQNYIDEMQELGYSVKNDRKCLVLAVHDVTLDFARGLNKQGYDNLSLDRLVEFRIHNVTPEFVSELHDLGYDKVDENRLVEMRIHNVSPDFIREVIKCGLKNLKPAELVEMRIHNVVPEYIHELNELGYKNIDRSRLVEMKIHGVSPDFIKDLQELGYRDISPARLVEMQIHNVDMYFIKGLMELGYRNLEPSRLVEMKIHDVSPYFIKGIIDNGYKDISPAKLVEMKIHGVDGSFIKQMKENGYDDLTPDELVSYKINGHTRKRDRTY